MKELIMACLLTLTGAQIKAQQTGKTIDVWPGQVPGATQPKNAPVKDSKNEPGTMRLTEVTNPTLEVYPPTVPGNGAAVIVCPGGAYSVLAYDKEGTDVARWLADQGFTAFTLAYRVPNQPDGALQDIQRAIRLVRHQYKLQTVGVIGFSAGASLSARAATRFSEKLYQPVDKADSQSCRPDFALLIYPAYLDQGPDRSLTPELTLTPQTPPMFIFATSDDYYGNSALVMAQALRDHKLPADLHFLARGGHGYGMRRGPGLVWPGMALEWLTNIMGEKK